jgi:hypothetical protein
MKLSGIPGGGASDVAQVIVGQRFQIGCSQLSHSADADADATSGVGSQK